MSNKLLFVNPNLNLNEKLAIFYFQINKNKIR